MSLSVGCATGRTHVTLADAPTKDASYEARAAYFKQHAPSSFDGTRVVLHDGTSIYWPEDLKPAVDPSSPTAKAIADAAAAREALAPGNAIGTTGSLLAAGGLVVMMGGLTVGIGETIMRNDGTHPVGDAVMLPSVIGGTGALLAGLGVAMVPGFLYAAEQEKLDDATRRVLTTYPQSLADRLAIQPDANGILVDMKNFQGEAKPAMADKTKEL